MQLHGQVVAVDIEYDPETREPIAGSGTIGVVRSTGSATLNQPDVVLRDAATGAEVDRTPRPQLEVQTVEVEWEDGSTSTLTECIDTWTVLGSVQAFPEIKDPSSPPPGAFGELPEQEAFTAAVDVSSYVADLRAAAPLAAASRDAERTLVLEDDGELSIVSPPVE